MNDKDKTEKAFAQLGLPPMELAESTANDPGSNKTQRVISTLRRIVLTLLLLSLTIGGCLTFTKIMSIGDNEHNTEIIIVTEVREPRNITILHGDSEIVPNEKNETLNRKKRSTKTTVSSGGENVLDGFSEKEIVKAREVILKHKPTCTEENKDCEELVKTLESVKQSDIPVTSSQEKHSNVINREDKVNNQNERMASVSLKHLTHSHGTKNKPAHTAPYPLDEQQDSEPYLSYSNSPINMLASHYGHHSHQLNPAPLTDTCLLAKLLNKNYPYNNIIPGHNDVPTNQYFPTPYGHNQPPHHGHYIAPSIQLPYRNREFDSVIAKKLPADAESIFRRYLSTTEPYFDSSEESLNASLQFEAQNFLNYMKSKTTKIPHSATREVECPNEKIPCNSGDECIDRNKWCDRKVDCSDVSDEASCTCRSRVDHSRLCDGYFDCPFGEDEMGCNGCAEDVFTCGDLDVNSQSSCFTKEQRCNNIADCPNRRDEIDCNMLAPRLHDNPLFAVSNTQGYLQRNFKGDWYLVCRNPYMWAHEACRRETGLITRPPFMHMEEIDPNLKTAYLNTGPDGLIYKSFSCFNSSAVYVTCPDLLCGTRVLSTSQLLKENIAVENHLFGRNKRFLIRYSNDRPLMFYKTRKLRKRSLSNSKANENALELNKTKENNIRDKRRESRVVGGKPSEPAAWPWMVAMYRNGMFHCGGVIITQNWILSAAHCVSNFWDHYFEIQVGMLRRFSFSPQEQNHLVTHIIVNHHYDKKDMRNDLSLLKVKGDMEFSRWVRPICLPSPPTAGPDWKWGPPAGTICTAVGWGATVEHGPDPDHMREVEVPIWENCKHREDRDGHEICAGFADGGKDACQGDSGGPLLCRNPMNSQQWYMAGIISHGDGCARKNEPGVYTRVSLFEKWIRYHIFAKVLPIIQPLQECPGFKCTSGIAKCLPKKRVCDKIIDCLNGEDETNCESSTLIKTFDDSLLLVKPATREAETESSALFNPGYGNNSYSKDSMFIKNIKDVQSLPSSESPNSQYSNNNNNFINQTKNDENNQQTSSNINETRTYSETELKSSTSEIPILKSREVSTDKSVMFSDKEKKYNLIDSKEKTENMQQTPMSKMEIKSFTLGVPIRKSEDKTNIEDISDEKVTSDPLDLLSSISSNEEENGEDSRGITLTLSTESLKSISRVKEKKILSSLNTTTESSDFDDADSITGSDVSMEDSLESLVTPTILSNNEHLLPNLTLSDIKNINTQQPGSFGEKFILGVNNVNFTTGNKSNKSNEDSKSLIVNLLPNSNIIFNETEISDEINKELQDTDKILDVENKSTTFITPKDKPNKLNISPTLPDFNFEENLYDKIKDMVLSQPAKKRRKHRIPKDFQCHRIYQTVSYHQRCDHKADCEDGSDEFGCTCVDYLTSHDESLLCDGVFDCADGQDEIDCFTCPEETFLCKRSQACIPTQNVCDGIPHCHMGEDELDCYTLSNGKDITYDVDGRPKVRLEGYVTKKQNNDWHIACEDNMNMEKQQDAANRICRYLGFSSSNRHLVKYINLKEDDILKQHYVKKRDSLRDVPVHFKYKLNTNDEYHEDITIEEPDAIKEHCVPNITKVCMSLYVFCEHSLFTEFESTQDALYERQSEMVTNHTWPWIAKVYSEGDYKCSGVLVNSSWVLVSSSCLWDAVFSQHYITVALGSHKTLHSTNGFYEQIYQVDGKKDLYRNRVILLHLKEPATYSSMVKPMVVQSHNLVNEKSATCVAIGQNDKNITVGMFLEETNENCDLHYRCFRRRQNVQMCSPGISSHHQWAGIISCHTEHGWYPAASFVDSRGECGIGNHILANDIGSIKNEMKNFVDLGKQEDTCGGERCGRGRCVKLRQLCDGVRHCEDGKDELKDACEKKRTVCAHDPYRSGCDCAAGQLKCHNGICVPKELFKDGRDDCGDGTDEPGQTTCAHYMARVMPDKLCDGILHCHDRSDEDPMMCKCFAKRSHRCGISNNMEICVAPDMVCDGFKDCPNGEDEETCMGLSAPEGTVYGTGEVIVRSHGVWHTKCYTSHNHTKSELEAICRELGFISGHAKQLNTNGKLQSRPRTEIILDKFNEVILNNSTKIKLRNTNSPIAASVVNDDMQNCHPVYIECL